MGVGNEGVNKGGGNSNLMTLDGNQCRKLLENLSYSVDDFGNPGIIAMVPLL